MTVIFLSSIFFLNPQGLAQNAVPFQLVYHQDANAKSIAGSIEDLKAAIRDGRRIRIYMNLGKVEHLMDAGFISIFEGHVFAQINTIQGQRPNPDTQEIDLRPYARHVGLYSTKSPYEMKWFAY